MSINNSLELQEQFLCICLEIISKTLIRNEITCMLCVVSIRFDCLICLVIKAKQSISLSNRIFTTSVMLSHNNAEPNLRIKLLIAEKTTTVPELSIKSLMSLPCSDKICLPSAILFLDFSFYEVISVREFAAVLDTPYASTNCPRVFPMRSKRSPIFTILQLIN